MASNTSDVKRKITSVNKQHDTLKIDLARLEHKQGSIATQVQMDVTGVRIRQSFLSSQQSIMSNRVNRELSTMKGQQSSFRKDLAEVRNQQSNFETRVKRDLTTLQREQADTTRTVLGNNL